MSRKGKLTIVVPCYNEEEILPMSAARLCEILTDLKTKGKIEEGWLLLVDDGSKDATWSIIEKLAAENSAVKGLKLAHNAGHQNALLAGLTDAHQYSDMTVSIDADLQDDETCIEQMVDYYNDDCEVVYGVRKERKTDTVFKRWTALGFYKMMNSMGTDIVYNHADYRLLGKNALAALLSMGECNLFLRGMVRLVGFKEAEVYYDRKERTAGESKYPLSKMLNFAVDGITSFSVKPLRLIFGTGVFFLLVTFVAICYALYSYITGIVIPGWTSLLISVWLIGGLLMLALGIIGEYIGKIYREVKRRPRFFIEKRV